jgi:thiol-disulfide isomerase/thioredoxin
VAKGEFASDLRQFPRRLGDLLIAPVRALGEIETRQRGGFGALVTWSLIAAVGLRFTSLADAVIGFEAGGGLRIVSVLVAELTQAIPVALAAALLVVVLAGAKRDPSVDLELGCGATIPFVVARAIFRTGVIVSGREPPTRVMQASYVVAGAWTLILVALAVRIARSRPRGRGPDATVLPSLYSRLAGGAAVGVLVVALGAGALWTARNSSGMGPVSRGSVAPGFTLPRVDGQPGTLSLASLRGRVVVLDFWATWCPPCLASLPTMHALSRELEPKGVTFVGVDSDGAQSTPDEVRTFLNEHGAPYPVVYDDGAANELYRIKVLPTIVVVRKDGTIERVLIGVSSKGTLTAAVESALAR